MHDNSFLNDLVIKRGYTCNSKGLFAQNDGFFSLK